MVQSVVDRSHCVSLDNGYVARVFPSRLNQGRWCFNLLRDGSVVGGDIGFTKESEAVEQAKAMASRRVVRAGLWRS
jgi:hypothetical protein